jgi:Flp pilus assembly protein TadD
MRAFQDALAISPGDVGVRIEYAKALEKLGDREFAREQYREALLRDDKLPPDEPKRLSAEQRKEIQAKIAG